MSIVCLLGVWVCLCVLYKRVRCACLLLCGVVKCVADVCCVCFFLGRVFVYVVEFKQSQDTHNHGGQKHNTLHNTAQ